MAPWATPNTTKSRQAAALNSPSERVRYAA